MQYLTTNTPEILLHFDTIHNYICHSYWAENIPKATLRTAIENSVNFAVIDEQLGLQAFARVITDKATFGYLADVFVLPEFRGQGLSKKIMEQVISHPDLQGLRRTMLATRDAHSLYTQYGFEQVTNPKPLMQIHKPDIYVKAV
ncbi:N-acetyltransferase [Pseudoalteromonas sp. A25]|uniref:GNAT family N-acetyltransferase n=1 Tax=Pseudoalteromonas sp. A25 TaxID=116092 RepID=UPI00129F7AAF|nr:GNAT family N-acetyltransferase [Pseudoalteromonas sp. A25]BBN82118.1 N-acetyltransferase [Pseudoalteromonas sp. A25]